MKICLFADIHGNGSAFRVAHEMILSEKADLNLFLGDLCGYYDEQLAILAYLKTIPNLAAVKGNHDVFFLQLPSCDDGQIQRYREKYGDSPERLRCEDGVSDLISWLSDQPETRTFEEGDLFAAHGCPCDPLYGYVYPDSNLDRFLEYQPSFFFLGHTHYPMLRRVQDKTIINPGSLGQPRQGGWPTYAVIDYPSGNCVFRNVKYDREGLINRLTERPDQPDQPSYLHDVLLRS